MTHPQDPEQQTKPTKHTVSCPHSDPLCDDCKAVIYSQAVEAYMRGMGYERPKRDDYRYWRKPSVGGEDYYVFLDKEQALDIYRASQAQVADVVSVLTAAFSSTAFFIVADLGSEPSPQFEDDMLKEFVDTVKNRLQDPEIPTNDEEAHEDAVAEIVAQLNPQKPKED
jgi:hypothetical protein